MNSCFDLRPNPDFLRECRRMSTALLLSLLIHALLLSLTFGGGQGLGLPGFGLPWRERRLEADDLRMVLVPAQVTASAPALIEPAADLMPTEMAKPKAATVAVAVMAPTPADGSGKVAPLPIPAPALIALKRSDAATLVVPVAPLGPTPVIEEAPSASSKEIVISAPRDAGDAAQKQIDPEVRERALELAKLDRSKLEAERQEAARQEAARQGVERAEAARLEADRQEAERQEASRQGVERAEAARREVERQEAARQEAARQGVERAEAARREVERQEAARQETTRQDKARQEAARKEQESRHEAALRSMARQLDEEAAKREAVSLAERLSSALPPTTSSARRGRLVGRTDPNAELILYAEAFSRKIQLNMTFDMVREAAKQPHTNPLVTVALRSDGSVESVIFVLSSGVAGIDEAIRRIVQSQVPYPPFPPGLAREFDVIEIRRTWYFDMAIRLY